MSHGQPQHIQRIVPCDCGSNGAYWHGPEDGAREYMCDTCWNKRHPVEEQATIMNTAKHTPGPWVFGDPSAKVPNRFVRDNQGDVVAYASANDIRQAQQDAHLIAAAPAMYEALHVLCKEIHGSVSIENGIVSFPDGGYLDLNPLLAQAEGRHS